MIDAVIFTSILICLLSIFFLFSTKNKFLGYNIFYIFSFIFFGVAPMLQYIHQVSFFGARPLTPSEYLNLNSIVLGILLVFHFGYRFIPARLFHSRKTFEPTQLLSNEKGILVFSVLVFSIKALFFIPDNLMGLFFRSENHVEYHLDPSLTTTINSLLVLFPATLMLHLFFNWKSKLNLLRLSILLVLLLCAFPLSISRTLIAAIYLPLIFILVPLLLKKNNFSFFVMGSVLFVFPFLNQFRDIHKLSDISFSSRWDVLKTAHFDSYYNFALILSEMSVQYGKQLLGVLLFFVPRSVWPEKPLGTGSLLAEKIHMNFNNISANFFAEGYINFGYFGIFLFAILLAFTLKSMDFSFLKSENRTTPYFVTYLQVVVLYFYLLRGDLMSAFSLLVSILLYNFVLIKLFYKTRA